MNATKTRRTVGITISKPLEKWIRHRCEEMFADSRCVSRYVEFLTLLDMEKNGRRAEFEEMVKASPSK